MNCQILCIEFQKIHIHLEVRNKLVLVTGNSGIGKSYMSQLIKQIQGVQHSLLNVQVIDSYEAYKFSAIHDVDFVIFDRVEQCCPSDDYLVDFVMEHPQLNIIIFYRGNYCVPCSFENFAQLTVDKTETALTFSLRYD